MTARTRGGAPDDQAGGRWRVLGFLALAELLGMSLWFSGSAVAGQLAARWSLTSGQSAWLTGVVQLGFVVGTAVAALFNLADVVPSRYFFAASAALGAAANATILIVPGYHTALLCRFATGACLAGVYPPAMKMISTWFEARRGIAIGTIVGALTVGKASPYLVHALHDTGVATVILVASASALLASIVVMVGYRDGPFPFPRRKFSWGLVAAVVREREWRLATGGYLGHMWELYSFWTWISAFFAANLALRARTGIPTPSGETAGLLAYGAITIGGLGCVAGGWIADRIGYTRLVSWSMALSGSCAIVIGATFGASFWLVTPVAWVWGIAVVADSAQFSTLVTRSVPAHAVGTALTLQTSLGFLLTMATIQLVPPAAEHLGWHWAFAMLALGPAFGIAAIRQLQKFYRSGRRSL